jgi:ABC-type oligopeptide transport system substrate-binding subunit
MSPVPQSAPEAGDRAFGEMPVGNGPFKMAEPWNGNRITLVRNDRYTGPKPALDGVRFTILLPNAAIDAEYQAFQAGEIDFAKVPAPARPDAKERYGAGFMAVPGFGVRYLVPVVANPPLDRPEARRAVSLAIDRDEIIEDIFGGFEQKATSIVPPRLEAAYQAGVCDTCDHSDVARAKQLAAQAGLSPGTRLSLMFNSDGGHEEWAQRVSFQLEKHLGLEVDLQAFPSGEYDERKKAKDAQGLFFGSWKADYPGPDAFLFPLLSKGSASNEGGYGSGAFEEVLAQGQGASDEDERVRLFRQAEQIAIGQDAALIPLWYRTAYRVYDAKRWEGVGIDFFENPTLTTIRPK